MRSEDLSSGYPAAAASVFAFTYIALPMGMLVQLRQQWAGAFYLLYLVAGGLGRRHLRLLRRQVDRTASDGSAHQSEEDLGRCCGFCSGERGVGWLLFHYALPLSSAMLRAGLIQRRDGLFGLEQPAMGPVILLTVVLNIAAQLGDLVESLIKRGAGVKDSGALLPGHGGMLDRIDALLFAAPVLWYYAAWRVMQ